MFKNIVMISASIFLMSCALIPNTYQAAPISGTVIDKDTELPLAGVNVVVYWQLYTGGLGGRVSSDILHVEETMTDKNGKYFFKGWGPVTTFKGRLGYQAPELLFFKPGYYYQRKGNSRTEMYFGSRGAGEIHVANADETSNGLLYRSQWDGRNIELKRYDENFDRMVRDFSNVGEDLHNILWGKGCESLKIRNIFTEYSRVGKEIINKHTKEKIKHSFDMIENSYDRDCGEVIKIYNGNVK